MPKTIMSPRIQTFQNAILWQRVSHSDAGAICSGTEFHQSSRKPGPPTSQLEKFSARYLSYAAWPIWAGVPPLNTFSVGSAKHATQLAIAADYRRGANL